MYMKKNKLKRAYFKDIVALENLFFWVCELEILQNY